MTVLNVMLRPDHALVATDSVATDLRDWGPAALIPKAAFLPSARLLFAATGNVLLLSEAFNGAILRSDREPADLRSWLPGTLKDVQAHTVAEARRLHPEENIDWTQSGRLYVFGWSSRDERIVGDVYAPDADWCDVSLQDGVEVNPPLLLQPDEPNPLAEVSQGLDLLPLISRQWRAEDARPLEDRNLIGGPIVFHSLIHAPQMAERDGGDAILMQSRHMGTVQGWEALAAEIDRRGPLQ